MILVVAGVVSYIGGMITKCMSVYDWYSLLQETATLAMMILQVTVLLLDHLLYLQNLRYHKSNQPKLLLFCSKLRLPCMIIVVLLSEHRSQKSRFPPSSWLICSIMLHTSLC